MSQKRFGISLIILMIVCTCRGQQDPQFSQYMYSDFTINPAIAGSAGICATTLFRQQWAGFVDSYTDENGNTQTNSTSPQEILFNIHSPVKLLHGGIGASFYRDHEGYQNNIDVKVAYAYKMNIGGGFLNIGAAFQMSNLSVDGEKYRPHQPGDPFIPTATVSDFFTDFSFGLYYKDNNDKWYGGLSLTQILGGEGDNTHQSTTRHIYLMGGYSFPFPFNPNWTIKPSFLLKSDIAKTQLDLSAVAVYENVLWAGVSYRFIDAFAIMFGAQPFIKSKSAIRGLQVGVSYDIPTSKLGYPHGRSFGSPEIMLKYCFNIVTRPPVEGYRNTHHLGNRSIRY